MSTNDTDEDLETPDGTKISRLSRKLEVQRCDYCDIQVTSRDNLKKHLFDAHDVIREYDAEELQGSSMGCNSDEDANAVLRLSHNLEKAVKKSEMVKDDPSISVSETKCKGCNFNQSSLRQHLAKSGKNCREQYSQEELQYLAQRAKSIHKEKVAQRSRRISEYHRMLKSQEKERILDFRCKICDEKFVAQYLLNRHMCESHSSEESGLKCTGCDITFSRQDKLDDHRSTAHHRAHDHRAHDVESKSHKCGICYKAFSQVGTLNRHIRNVHGGERKYECGECPSRFARREDLEKHVQKGKHKVRKNSSSKSVHKKDNPETADEHDVERDKEDTLDKEVKVEKAELECNVCGKVFTQSGSLHRHIANAHEGKKEHKCSKCPAQFCERRDLEKHLQKGKHYKVREPYKCPYCGETMIFKSTNAWNTHFVKDKTRVWYINGRGFSKNTCVSKLKRENEQLERFKKATTPCIHCGDMIPNEYVEHWVEEDLEDPEKSTCVNNIMKRQHMTCWMCKGKIDPKDCIREYNNRLILNSHSGHFYNCINPVSCGVVLKRSREEYKMFGAQLEEMQKKRNRKFYTYFLKKLPKDRKVSWKEYKIAYCNTDAETVKTTMPVDPELPMSWLCCLCDPEPEFSTSRLLIKHFEIVHPEIDSLCNVT